MKFTKLALTFLSCAVLFCGCVKNSDVVLKVNDKEITRAEFYDDFNKIKNLQLKNAPKEMQKDGSYIVLALKDRFLNDMITRELLLQEFDKRKIEASEEEIKAKKAQVIAQIGSEEQFNNILKQNGISEQKLNADMASEVKMDKLIESLGSKTATNSEIEKFYKQNKAQFNTPERVKISQILIDTNFENIKRQIADADSKAQLSTNDIDAKAKAEVERKEKLALDVQKKAAAAPKKFAQFAREYSDDAASKEKGGDVGFVTREGLLKELSDVAFSQKIGTVSKPIKTQNGTYIIIVTDKAAKGVQSLDSVREDLRAYLTQQNKMQTVRKFMEGLRANAKIEYVDENLNPENLKKQIETAAQKQQEEAMKKMQSQQESKESKSRKIPADKFKKN